MGLIRLLETNPAAFFIIACALVFALCFHEFSHALMAYRCGDDTAARMGRLSLNPIDHLDLLGSMMILFAGFGWAKPVPVNPMNLKDIKYDSIKIAAAGPLSNLFLALIASFIYALFNSYVVYNQIALLFFVYFININIMLCIFNLLPIHPLDGGQIFNNLMYKYNPDLVRFLQRYGTFILIGIFIFGRFLISYPVQIVIKIIQSIFGIYLGV